MKFSRDTAYHFSWPGIEGWAYGSKDVLPTASASVIQVDGSHGSPVVRSPNSPHCEKV